MLKATAPRRFVYGAPGRQQAELPFLLNSQPAASRTLLSLARAIFLLEDVIKNQPVDHLEIIVEDLFTLEQLASVKIALQRLIRYVLLSEVEVSLNSSDHAPLNNRGVGNHELTAEAVCLFSGGVDSLSGAMTARRRYGSLIGVYCSHANFSRLTHIVRQLGSAVFEGQSSRLVEVPGPAVGVTGYSQTRGFLYVLTGASVAAEARATKLVVSECGPTMFQPHFAPADLITMTTHPFVMARAQEIVATVAPNIAVDFQFKNQTKAEIVALCPSPELLPLTHSCVSQRLVEHDGTCYGCVIRRLATIATGVKDRDYLKNPMIDPNANSGNLLALLGFCRDLLLHRGAMPEYQTGPIEELDRWDLFERYALDNFTALWQSGASRLAPPVRSLLEEVVATVGQSALTKRADVLEEMATLS